MEDSSRTIRSEYAQLLHAPFAVGGSSALIPNEKVVAKRQAACKYVVSPSLVVGPLFAGD